MVSRQSKQQSSTVGLRELRENLEHYIGQIQKGHSFTVIRRSVPVFKIAPLYNGDEGLWEDVIDFTKIKKGGIPLNELLARM